MLFTEHTFITPEMDRWAYEVRFVGNKVYTYYADSTVAEDEVREKGQKAFVERLVQALRN